MRTPARHPAAPVAALAIAGLLSRLPRLPRSTVHCPRNRFCMMLYTTADVPFSFDFTAINGLACEFHACQWLAD